MVSGKTHFADKLASYSGQDNLSSHQQGEALFDEESESWTEILLGLLQYSTYADTRPSGIVPILLKPIQSKHNKLWSNIEENLGLRDCILNC